MFNTEEEAKEYFDYMSKALDEIDKKFKSN